MPIHPAEVVDVPGQHQPGNCKVRAVAFSAKRQELGAVTMDGYFHLWKAQNTLSRLLSIGCLPKNDVPDLLWSCPCTRWDPSPMSLSGSAPGSPERGTSAPRGGTGCALLTSARHIITVGTGHALLFYDITCAEVPGGEGLGQPALLSTAHREGSGSFVAEEAGSTKTLLPGQLLRCLRRLAQCTLHPLHNWPEMKLSLSASGPLLQASVETMQASGLRMAALSSKDAQIPLQSPPTFLLCSVCALVCAFSFR